MALVETALPMLMSRELDTMGFHDYGGRLRTGFTAHPKICPLTGELHFFGYDRQPPFLTYHAVDASGRLMRSIPIPVKGPTMVHDFALTASHIVLMDLPVVFDMASAQRGTMPFAWSDDYGARLGILPRGADLEALRWVEVEPCYVYHAANASGASRAEERCFDDLSIEFPRINDRRAGLPHTIVYAVETANDIAAARCSSVVKYDLRSGKTTRHDFGSGLPSELPQRSRSFPSDRRCGG